MLGETAYLSCLSVMRMLDLVPRGDKYRRRIKILFFPKGRLYIPRRTG